MSEDISNLMQQVNNMIQNNQIPDDIKNLISNFSANSNDDGNSNKEDVSSNSSSSIPEFDMATMMKMKKIIDSMNSGKDDPRANLLLSLKPYLKESRKSKVDQYIQIFKMGKAFEILSPLGGESKK